MSNQSLGSLTTPQDYIDYYYNELKSQLQTKNIQISKVGFLGFLLHTLGFTQFDIKTYYDTLFKEAFLATSDDSKNLNLHASIYNYDIKMSNPSNITGNLKISLSFLPPSINITLREIVIEKLKININNIIFTLESTYTIIDTFCKIQKSNGEIYYIPFDQSTGLVPIMDFYQYDTEIFNFKLPYYSLGTFYQKILNLEYKDGFIYEISITIKTKDSNIFEEYSITQLKHLSSSLDKVVFVENKISTVILEFGSGVYGMYVSEAEVNVNIKVTSGSSGNISKNTAIPYDGMLKVYDYSNRNTVFNIKPMDIIKVDVNYSSGGTDISSGNDLRHNIINYIQTRNNLISETDYYNVIKQYCSDFILLFRKAHLIDNCIYCFLLLRDLYQNPILSKSISIKHGEFNTDSKSVIYKPDFYIDSVQYISPFIYIFDEMLLEYPAYVYFENYNIYFSEISIIDESTILSIPPLSLYFNYSNSEMCTKVIARSYQTISQYQLYISIPQYNIFDECMLCYDDNAHIYSWFSEFNGIITDCFDVEIKMYINNIYTFDYKHINVCLIHDISQLLTLKIFRVVTDTPYSIGIGGPNEVINNDDVVMHIPVVLLTDYELNMVDYDNRIFSTLSNMSITQNKMISDTLQFRFLNTEFIPSIITNVITLQKYEFDILLPLILTVNIIGNKNYFSENNTDSISEIEELKLELVKTLYSDFSGIKVAFYQSKIIDTIHNKLWVKSCNIIVNDSNDTPIIIPNSNFELIDQKNIISKLDKDNAVNFCPVYMYWDLENITINVSFE